MYRSRPEPVQGHLFTYYKDPYCKIPVFMMNMDARRCVLWVGGQTESLLSFDYFTNLAEELQGDWAFVQVEVPSGKIGSGPQDHAHDAEDVDDLIGILLRDHCMNEVALFATSTGTQLVFELLENSAHKSSITRVILHGVVCDPENPLFTPEGCAARKEHVEKLMAEGRGEDSLAMLKHYDIPITPARLAGGGFPTLQEAVWNPCIRKEFDVLRRSVGVIKVPLLLMLAHNVQYKPSDEEVGTVLEGVRDHTGCNRVTVSYFNDTCDELRRVLKAAESEHVAAILQFLADEDEFRTETEKNNRIKAAEDEKKRKSVLQVSSFAQAASSVKAS
ncbi:paraflagellar rod component, putative [Trypanosoma equiperdum]|uniref:Paraflagellar rod component n=3 Tax=Trypanozoon TaxID=39700 RepID=Q389W3_TRYB2|nr:hypothetical protein, conserved [Trypanosoma brucei gambiense DAL972]XP_823235.1 hypothetical protein, conserved [Trypanosoma brucei brucei TREU927]EAN78407.1 hypothetical protein, conserved [Trypanosoma brucei brucei TREU927]CBH16143.1 hypothetical protein, conserved [Trypanosoma brucei gambiense DAL972]SCU67985.1 paraflagellar rod component, putative [Trypanosoma equiperdum]|eukprot:XP_011778407.1 hypothetical protein, conserved [Trypanosoma brucei gambiense DAL972]